MSRKDRKKTHRRDRVVRRFLYVIAAGVLLALLAPTLIGVTPLRDAALARALPAGAGRLTATGASLSWFTPVSLSGVRLAGADGRVLATAESVRVDRSLLALMMAPRDLGTIRVDRPAVFAVVRPDGSNLEDFASALAGDGPAGPDAPPEATPPTRATIVVSGGSIALTDTVTGLTTIHDPIDVEASLGGTGGGLSSLTVTGSAHAMVVQPGGQLPVLPLEGPDARRGGGFAVAAAPNEAGETRASFKLEAVDAGVLAPLLRRIDPTLFVGGVLNGGGELTWWASSDPASPLPARVQARGALRATGVQIAAAATNGDTIASRAVDLALRVTTTAEGRVDVRQLELNSDFGDARVVGEFSPEEVRAITAGDWSGARSATLSADLDLARLAQVAPDAMRLRPGVALRSGDVKLSATVRPDGDGRTINATLVTADLVATRGGQPIRWDKPIQLTLAARQSPAGLKVSRLECESSFLTGRASGDPTNLTAEFRLDLDKLTADARRLFDFGPWRLSGQARANAQLTRDAGDRFRATGRAGVDGCVVSYNDRPVVLERKLTIDFAGEGRANPATGQLQTLQAATMNVLAGGDRLDARLTEPVAWSGDSYPLEVRIAGDVAAWVRRVQFVAPADATDNVLNTLQAAGAIDARATGRFGPERVQLARVNLAAEDLRLQIPGVAIDEPRLTFVGDLSWDAATGDVASRAGELVSQTVALRARDMLVRGAEATGELAVRADLTRLAAVAPGALGDRRLEGQVVGRVQLATSGGAPVATLDLTTSPFAISEPGPNGQPQVLWREPTVAVRGAVSHSATEDRLTLTDLALRSQNLSGVVSGQIDRLSIAPTPALNGTIDYDLAQLTPLVASWLGPGVRVAGKHRASFQVAAAPVAPGAPAPWSRAWTGRVTAPWSGASLYGLPIGEGSVTATLGEGMLRFDPLVFAVGQGRLATQPAVRFDPAPAEWGLPAGDLLTGVAISPEVSDQMLKFFAPVLADATRSEGVFSIRTDGVRAPLDNAAGLQTTGQLTLQAVRVRPGPSVSHWVSAARTVEALAKDRDPAALAARPQPTLLSISERTVNFQVVRERVYHEGLEFEVDGVPVSSSGSVGFNETLKLTLTVPIQDRWIANERRLVGLRGQVLQLPVEGTLSNPKIDRNQLRAFSQQLLQSGLRGAVESEIGRALEKLFN